MVNTLVRFETRTAEYSFVIPVGNSKGISPENITQTVYIDIATGRPYQDGTFVEKGETFWKWTRSVINDDSTPEPDPEEGEKELMKRKVDFPNLDTIEFVSTIVREDFEPMKRNEEVKEMTINSGGNNMNTSMFGNMFKNMKFGKLETNDIKYSMKGIAFKTTNGDYVCYNPDFTFTNVANMVMDMPMFAMPVSKDQIKVGDVIDHNGTWVIVSDVTPSEIKVARPLTKEIVSVIPETSIFGFSFYTKVMNPFENFGATATADNPFGNILPFMLMNGGDTKNSNDMLMMMLAFGGGKIDFSNPMMMYMLMGDKGNTNDILMMMMLSGNNPFEQKHECKCSCKVGDVVFTPNNSIDPYFGVDCDWTQFVPMNEVKIDVSAMDIENK